MADSTATLEIRGEIRDIQQKLAQLQQELEATRGSVEALDAQKVELNIDFALQRIRELESELDQLTADENEVDITIDEDGFRLELQGIRSAVEDGVNDLNRAAGRLELEERLEREARAAAQAADQQFDRLVAAWRQAVRDLNAASAKRGFDQTSEAAIALQAAVLRTGQAVTNFARQSASELGKGTAAFKRVEQATNEAEVSMKKFGGALPTREMGLLERQVGATVTAFKLFIASLLVQKIQEFAREIVTLRNEYVALENTLAVVVGSNEAAAAEFDRMFEVANRLGIRVEAVTDRFARFAVAAKESGFSLQETRDIFDSMAIAAAGLQLSVSDVRGAFTALEQILSKGKLSAEELRQQLGERIPGVLPLLQKQLGITGEELDKLLRTGSILAEEALPALAVAFRDTFSGAATRNAASARAEINRLLNEFQQLGRVVGEQLEPAVLRLVSAVRSLGDSEAGVNGLVTAFEAVLNSVTQVVNIIDDLRDGNPLRALAEAAQFVYDAFQLVLGSLGSLVTLLDQLTANSIPGLRNLAEGFTRTNKEIERFQQKLRDVVEEDRGNIAALAAERERANQERLRQEEETLARLRDLQQRAANERKGARDKEAADEKKSLDKRLGEWRSFFTAITSAAKRTDTAPEVPDAPSRTRATGADLGGGDELAALLTQLRQLRQERDALADKPLLEVDEANRIQELGRLIFEVESRIARLGQTAQGASAGFAPVTASAQEAEGAVAKLGGSVVLNGQTILEALQKLVVGNEAFAASFKQLDADARNAVLSAIGTLEGLASEGLATEDTLTAVAAKIADAFRDVDPELAALVEGMAGISGPANTATQAILAMQRELNATATAAGEAGGTITTAKGEVIAIGGAFQEAATTTRSWADVMAHAQSATEGLRAGTVETKAAVETLSDVEGRRTDLLRSLAAHLTELQAIQAQRNAGLLSAQQAAFQTAEAELRFREELESLGVAVEDGQSLLEAHRDALAEVQEVGNSLAGEMGDLGTSFTSLTDAVEGTSKASLTVEQKLRQIRGAASSASGGLRDIGVAASGTRGALSAVEGVLRTLVGVAPTMGTVLGDLFQVFQSGKMSIDDVRTSLDQTNPALRTLGEALDDAGTSAVALPPALQPLAEVFAELGISLAPVGDALVQIETSIASVQENAEGVAEGLALIAEAAAEGVEGGDLDLFREAIDQMAESVGLSREAMDALNERTEALAASLPEGAAGAEELKAALEGLVPDGVEADLDKLEAELVALKGELDAGEISAEEFAARLQAAADDSQRLAEGIGQASGQIQSNFVPALQNALGKLADIQVELQGTTGDAGATVDEFGRFAAEGVPSINATTTAVGGLRDALNDALAAARALADQLANMPEPGAGGDAVPGFNTGPFNVNPGQSPQIVRDPGGTVTITNYP